MVDCQNGVLDNYFTGATIKHLVGAKLQTYVIPIPPKDEQIKIVAKVNELLALCAYLSFQIESLNSTQVNLSETIIDAIV